jgi:hypothetical protein
MLFSSSLLAVYELDNDAQSTLIQARSRLRQQSHEALCAKHLQKPTSGGGDKLAHSPNPSVSEAIDSAYASSPEAEPRPTTSPAPQKPSAPGLGIWPSTSASSLPSLSLINYADVDSESDKDSCTALPPVVTSPKETSTPTTSTTAPNVPSSHKRGSNQPSFIPSIRKRTSLTALRKFFSRGKGASAQSTGNGKMEEETMPAEKEKLQAKLGVKKTPLGDVFELPG